MTSVRTHLWFGNDKAVEAAHFYAEHIPDSAVTRVVTARTSPDDRVAEVVEFTLAGHEVIGLNAGPMFHPDEAFSFYLGISWQVIPRELEDLSGDYSTEANQRVCQAMLKMGKIDVAQIQAAYDGG